MKQLLTISLLFFSSLSFCQNSVKVKITKIVIKDSVTTVWMKSKKAKFKTSCLCIVPYKRNDVVYIKKPIMY